MTVFIDMNDHDEDCRIRTIGNTVMENPGSNIGFLTDDEPGKPERYIAKVQEWFPYVQLVGQQPGPVPKTVLVTFIRKIENGS